MLNSNIRVTGFYQRIVVPNILPFVFYITY